MIVSILQRLRYMMLMEEDEEEQREKLQNQTQIKLRQS